MRTETIRFPLASVTLTDTHKKVLKDFVDSISGEINLAVTGHACTTPVVSAESLKNFKDNDGFAEARARSVVAELKQLILLRKGMPWSVATAWDGDRVPESPTDLALNRRVVIILLE